MLAMTPLEVILKRGRNVSKFHIINWLTMAHYHEQRKEIQEYIKELLFYFFFLLFYKILIHTKIISAIWFGFTVQQMCRFLGNWTNTSMYPVLLQFWFLILWAPTVIALIKSFLWHWSLKHVGTWYPWENKPSV